MFFGFNYSHDRSNETTVFGQNDTENDQIQGVFFTKKGHFMSIRPDIPSQWIEEIDLKPGNKNTNWSLVDFGGGFTLKSFLNSIFFLKSFKMGVLIREKVSLLPPS